MHTLGLHEVTCNLNDKAATKRDCTGFVSSRHVSALFPCILYLCHTQSHFRSIPLIRDRNHPPQLAYIFLFAPLVPSPLRAGKPCDLFFTRKHCVLVRVLSRARVTPTVSRNAVTRLCFKLAAKCSALAAARSLMYTIVERARAMRDALAFAAHRAIKGCYNPVESAVERVPHTHT